MSVLSEGNTDVFWQLWQQHQDYLYCRCLSWMSQNPTDAEDVLSFAMLKAWEKLQKYAGEITNFKAWLPRLTSNLCVDIHRRQRCRGFNIVDNIETIAEEQELVSENDTPITALEENETKTVIHHAIDNLTIRLRETFVLHFYEQLSSEIAEKQNISYDYVCKRISQARTILRKQLTGYSLGENENKTIFSEMQNPSDTDKKPRQFKENEKLALIEKESIALSETGEEVKVFSQEKTQKYSLKREQIKPFVLSDKSDIKLEQQQALVWEAPLKNLVGSHQLDKETGCDFYHPYLVQKRNEEKPDLEKKWKEACNTVPAAELVSVSAFSITSQESIPDDKNVCRLILIESPSTKLSFNRTFADALQGQQRLSHRTLPIVEKMQLSQYLQRVNPFRKQVSLRNPIYDGNL